MLEVSFLIPEQLITRAVVNITSMTVNVAGNALVICILIKTEQLSDITFKLIFSLTRRYAHDINLSRFTCRDIA